VPTQFDLNLNISIRFVRHTGREAEGAPFPYNARDSSASSGSHQLFFLLQEEEAAMELRQTAAAAAQ
jgi:hypothetical protein